MADGNLDLSKLASALPAVMNMTASGMAPRGEDDYDPRSGVFANNVPNWFSFGQTLSQLGTSGLFAGTGLDTWMQVNAQPMMARLQAQSGVDPMVMAQSRASMQAIMETQFMGQGKALVESMGMDPNSTAGHMFSMMAPMMIQAMPELAGLAYSMAPTAMFTGGKNIVAALQMLDPMSQIRPGEASAMYESMRRLGTHNGFMNTAFTHGENMDDFAIAEEFTADMRINAQGLDIEDMRAKTRDRLRKDRFGKRETLTQSENDDLDTETTKVVAKDRRTISASMNAEIAQAVKSALGGSTSQAFNFMKDNGLVANNQDQADTVSELIRNLDALGKQAGVTMKDMMNAGRIMSAQNGGDALSAASAYGLVESVSKRLGQYNEDNHVPGDPNAANTQKEKLHRFTTDAMTSATAYQMAALYDTSEGAREDIKKGDLVAIGRRIKGLINPQTAEDRLANHVVSIMTKEKLSDIENTMYRATAGESPATIVGLIGAHAQEHLGVGSKYEYIFQDKALSKTLAADLNAGVSTDQMLRDLKLAPGKESEEFVSTVLATQMGDRASMASAILTDHAEANVAVLARSMEAGRLTERANMTAGLEGPVIANLLKGNITDFKSAMSAWGKLRPEDMVKMQTVMDNFSPAEQKEFVSATQQERSALRLLMHSDTLLTKQEDKQKAEADLLNANDRLHELGLSPETMTGGDKIGKWTQEERDRANAEEQKKDAAKPTTDDSAAPVAPPTTSGAAPKTGTDVSSNQPATAVKGEICITIVDQRGAAIPDGQWTLSAIKKPGFLDMIKGKALG